MFAAHREDLPSMLDGTVFIIEDNAGVRTALVMMIESLGWKTRSFESTKSFLDAYSPSGKDFLLLDLHMPDMSGIKLLEELSARNHRIPTAIMMAYPDDSLVSRAMNAGAAAVLTKPFKSTQLAPLLELSMDGGKTPD